MKKILVTPFLLLNLFAFTALYAQKPVVVADSKAGWHRIGGLQASFKKQNESIMVLGNDEFTALKVKVVDAPIHIERMQVFYENGAMEDIDVKKAMNAGETSQVFDLQHPGKDISKVAFTYHSVANSKGEKAEVEIYGLKRQENTGIQKTKDEANRDMNDAREDAKEAGNDVESAAGKAADEVSETAGKAAADVDDKRLDGKVGPNGQTVFIADDGTYYYINEQGKRVSVTEMQLKEK